MATNRRRYVRAMRRAARKHLNWLIVKQLGKCAICGLHLHLHDKRPAHIVTVDHVTALHDGGTSELRNLRAVHALCNHLEDLTRRGLPTQRNCRTCEKPSGHRRHCDECRAKLTTGDTNAIQQPNHDRRNPRARRRRK